MIVYDTRFNANEWLTISGFCIGYLAVFLLPKRFPIQVTLMYIMCGIYGGFFYDSILSVEPIDYYDVNDTSNYQFLDFISYLMYGAYSYVFFYLGDRLRLKIRYAPIYIFAWGLVSIGLEKIADLCGVYHYKNGYGLVDSFPIYLLTLGAWSAFYFLSQRFDGLYKT